MENRKLDQILGNAEREIRERVEKTKQKEEKARFKFDYTPRELKEELSKYVIGQEEALVQVCNAVCYHYQALSSGHDNSKSNVMMIGPTGCGKTYIMQKISEIIKVPILISDATKYSGTGYVGDKVENLVSDLIAKADGNLNSASRGIIYIDEIDKIAVRDGSSRDVSGRDVQNGLLKIIEGSDVKVHLDGVERLVNTKDMLFMCGGAFSDLYKILKGTAQTNPSKDKDSNDGETLYSAKPEQLLKSLQKYGMIPELLGRIPVIAKLTELSVDDLSNILVSSQDSVTKAYQKDLAIYNINLQFTPDAYKRIAQLAHERRMGARGLKSVVEESLSSYKFYLPGTDIKELTISSQEIDHPEESLLQLLETYSTKSTGGVKNGSTK